MTSINKTPTWSIQTLLQDALEQAIIQNPSTVHIIRKNARPVMIESDTLQDNEMIKKIGEHYNIQSHIIAEILSNAQMIWFLDGSHKTVSEETLESNTNRTKAELIKIFIDAFVAPKSQIDTAVIEALDIFFTKLAATNLIQTLQQKQTPRKDMPRWVIRQISLFDMDYRNTFSNIQERLDFIMINIHEQDRLFGDDYVTMIQENWWLPVDDIVWKETTMLSPSSYYGNISTITYEGQKINTLMRIIPWFSPVGIDIMAWLDLPNGNQNYFATIWIQFERYNNQIVPAIHTIQLSTHNIWSDVQWQLVWIKEPYDKNTVNMKQRMKIINAFTNSIYDFDWLRDKLVEVSHSWLPIESIGYLEKNTLQSVKGKYVIQWDNITLLWTSEERKKTKDIIINAVIEHLKNDWALPLLVSTLNYLFSHGYPAVIIHNAEKNMRLQQHNQYRSEKSIVSSWENLYTKKAKQLWWIQNEENDYVITPASYFNAMNIPLYWHQYVNMNWLMNAKNEIFPTTNHPATTKLFSIDNTIDRLLLENFIQSPTYYAR